MSFFAALRKGESRRAQGRRPMPHGAAGRPQARSRRSMGAGGPPPPPRHSSPASSFSHCVRCASLGIRLVSTSFIFFTVPSGHRSFIPLCFLSPHKLCLCGDPNMATGFSIPVYSNPASSFSHCVRCASLGIRQSPRGESATLPTLGPSGRQFRLNCWVKNLR